MSGHSIVKELKRTTQTFSKVVKREIKGPALLHKERQSTGARVVGKLAPETLAEVGKIGVGYIGLTSEVTTVDFGARIDTLSTTQALLFDYRAQPYALSYYEAFLQYALSKSLGLFVYPGGISEVGIWLSYIGIQ